MRQKGLTPIAIVIIILIVGAIGFIVYQSSNSATVTPTPIANSPTSGVNTPEGLMVNITPNQTISSPLTISGTIPAGWMFEGSFPITILDQDENVITQSFGQQIEGENWMSGNPVQFEATIPFTRTATSGFVRLAKDNPSGLPENDEHYDIPVKFAAQSSTGQMRSDTTIEYEIIPSTTEGLNTFITINYKFNYPNTYSIKICDDIVILDENVKPECGRDIKYDMIFYIDENNIMEKSLIASGKENIADQIISTFSSDN